MSAGGASHVYRGSPCVPGTDPRECPGCRSVQDPPEDGDVRWSDDEHLEVFDGGEWCPLERLPS